MSIIKGSPPFRGVCLEGPLYWGWGSSSGGSVGNAVELQSDIPGSIPWIANLFFFFSKIKFYDDKIVHNRCRQNITCLLLLFSTTE